MASAVVLRMVAILSRRRRSWALEAALVSVISVSQRSNATARKRPDVGRASARPSRSLQLDTSSEPILVPMKILQRLLGILPAVVTRAAVGGDAPDALFAA